MQAPSTRPARRSHMQVAIGMLVTGLLFVFVPIIVVVAVAQQPFPGAVVGPSEVAPVLGMLLSVVATLMIVQELFGY